MKHARHAADPAPTAPRTTRNRATAKHAGRHVAGPATRQRRSGPSWSSLAPKSWPVSLGVGLAVTMATTTGLSVASGTTGVPHSATPDTSASGIRATPEPADSGTALGTEASTERRSELVAERSQAASRSGERSARTAPGSAGLVVADDAAIPSEDIAVDVESAPEPPVLPGCDGEATGAGTNGNISSTEMCSLWDGGPMVRADAAVALARLNEAYVAAFGQAMCVTDGYRSYSQQVAARAAKGSLVAPPGTSNHGWGLAVDLCPETYTGDRYDWLAQHGPTYGWDNPAWARPGGSKYEPWHWEFTAAVEAAGGVS